MCSQGAGAVSLQHSADGGTILNPFNPDGNPNLNPKPVKPSGRSCACGAGAVSGQLPADGNALLHAHAAREGPPGALLHPEHRQPGEPGGPAHGRRRRRARQFRQCAPPLPGLGFSVEGSPEMMGPQTASARGVFMAGAATQETQDTVSAHDFHSALQTYARKSIASVDMFAAEQTTETWTAATVL